MSDLIRICFIAPKAYPLFVPSAPGPFGGAEVDLCLLATELAKDPAFDVSFITADYGQPAEQRIEQVRLLKSVNFRRSPLCNVRRIWSAMKQADARFYFLEAASPGVPLAQRFCRRYGRMLLYRTAHQWECDGTYLKAHPWIGRLFIRSLRRAGCVITQNETDRDNLRSNFNIDSIVIPNGHRLDAPGREPRDVILWVGRSAAFKRPERFIELARRFPQERFVMICRRATGDRNFQQLSRQAAEVKNLEFIPGVEFRRSDDWFRRAKVYVNTSDAEGFANTFVQAAKAAAAILSWTVNPDQFLTKHQCGLACDADMERFVRGLAYLLENDRYKEIGQNGLRYCRERHDITVIAETYKDLLRTLAGAGPK